MPHDWSDKKLPTSSKMSHTLYVCSKCERSLLSRTKPHPDQRVKLMTCEEIIITEVQNA